jgi:hypothetical protein
MGVRTVSGGDGGGYADILRMMIITRANMFSGSYSVRLCKDFLEGPLLTAAIILNLC